MSLKESPQKRVEAEALAVLGDFSQINSLEKDEKEGMPSQPAPALQLTASKENEAPVQRQVAQPGYPDVDAREDFKTFEPTRGSFMERGEGDNQYIHYNDVSQGNLNNCYIMAALSSLAHTRPQLLANLVRFVGDNVYEVTLYRRNWRGEYSPETYQVTADFPNTGFWVGARPGDNQEFWPMLFEKAFALHYGGSYNDIDNAGNPQRPLGNLMGFEGTDFNLWGNLRLADMTNVMTSAMQTGTPCIVGTPSFYRNPLLKGQAEELGIIPGHAYTCISTDGTNVRLYNPQGSESEEGKGPEILVSFANIKKFFSRLVVGS